MKPRIPMEAIDHAVRMALAEDLGDGDVTSMATIPAGTRARAAILAREDCTLAGVPVAKRVFAESDPHMRILEERRDGERISPGNVVLHVEANARAILAAERVALNFVQRLSGIASETQQFRARAGEGVAILHTRKTTPGLRALERYAVLVGGGSPHRQGLYDEILIKENHLALAGTSVRETVVRAREFARSRRPAAQGAAHGEAHVAGQGGVHGGAHGAALVVGVEATTEAEARAAIDGGADYVLLDNIPPAVLAEWLPKLRAHAKAAGRTVAFEASGGIRKDNIAEYAAAGVDRISCGALTHSARSVDFALDVFVVHETRPGERASNTGARE
jgi:nicotinate-nucleotide pyrophosphorylase (carboxylating)